MPGPKHPYRGEVRLGLVLYGGVSLAIYENGVANEIYRAVRGQGGYGLLKDLMDSDIVLDIISGTSAGGVNGVMLGHALANGLQFGQVADLWRNQGDIQKLLRDPDDANTSSILNSEGFYQPRLQEALQGMNPWRAAPSERPSDIDELDLFVTGTNVYGDVSTTFDELGDPVDIKNHRAVFKLAYRKGRLPGKNDFRNPESLATLCRLTSCFPVAFAPVEVTPCDVNLRQWGKLKNGKTIFLDGGILQNKPFSYTLDAISRRTASRPVERFLFYVEPDPERFKPSPQDPSSPTIARAAFEALIDIPGYQSISADLQAINAHNDTVNVLKELFKCIPKAQDAGDDCLDKTDAVASPDDCVYLKARLLQLRDMALEKILDSPAGREFISVPAERQTARRLVKGFDDWSRHAHDKDRDSILESFDVYFRQRRVSHLTYALVDPDSGPHDDTTVRLLLSGINHYFQVCEIIRWAMETCLERKDFRWREISDQEEDVDCATAKWEEAAGELSRILSASGLTVPKENAPQGRDAFYVELKRRLEDGLPGKAEGNLLKELDRGLIELLRKYKDTKAGKTAIREFCNYWQVDRILFPLQFAAGTESRDTIRVVRFSPVDAQVGRSHRIMEKKVAGTALANFGGFFKKSWRANDILWGRLDAACQIVKSLFQLKWTRSSLVGHAHLGPRIAAMFPHSSSEIHNALAVGLLGSHTPGAADNEIRDMFITAIQDEIVAEEWHKVMESAMDQERDWSQTREVTLPAGDQPYDALHLSWKPNEVRPDQIIVALAAQALAAKQLPAFDGYDIAGRPFDDEIPLPVLFELGMHVAMRLGPSLADSAPKPDSVKDSGVYRTLFKRIIPFLYNWSKFQRTAPSSRVWLISSWLALAMVGFVASVFLILHAEWPKSFSISLSWQTYSIVALACLASMGLIGWWIRPAKLE